MQNKNVQNNRALIINLKKNYQIYLFALISIQGKLIAIPKLTDPAECNLAMELASLKRLQECISNSKFIYNSFCLKYKRKNQSGHLRQIQAN